ncbi:MAG: tetratricopeptide repeat protein [Desulfobacteraceae bacterium]|nr:tetratricopeptide repeat protein [Desulfobacteraceae bacterium]
MKIFLASSLIWLLLPIAAQFLSQPSIDLYALIILILLAPWFICMFFRWQVKGLTVGDGKDVQHFPPVRTGFLLIAVIILIELFSLAAAGMFIKDRYKLNITDISSLVQFIEMTTKDLKKSEVIRVPVKKPPRIIATKPDKKDLPKAAPSKEVFIPKSAKKVSPGKPPTEKILSEKPAIKKPHLPALSSPDEKPVLKSMDYDKEIRALDEFITKDRQNAELYYSRGCLYERKGDLDKAKKDFTKSIEINNRVSDTYYNRGLVFVRKKQYALAIKDFDRAIELDSQAADAYCNRGSANYQLGKSDLAIRDYNEGLKINPDDADLYYNRGVVHLSKGMRKDAKADFKKAAMLGHVLASEMISKQK